jgi:hypothetical protein
MTKRAARITETEISRAIRAESDENPKPRQNGQRTTRVAELST